MSSLEREKEFFHYISAKVRDLVDQSSDVSVSEDKGAGDYSTLVDVAVENLIVAEIQKRFPGDLILAEEGHADVKIPSGRIWIIDPICGTTNLGKGIHNFCTNIALADERQLVAACVVDHNQKNYFWSVGNNEVYINDTMYKPNPHNPGIKIDVDHGSVKKAAESVWKKHNNALLRLTTETDYSLISLNTSLSHAYTAVCKIDGFIYVYNHPWDICAASFLLQQTGGIITSLEGNPWMVTTIGAIGASTPELHQQLLDIYATS